MQQIKIRPQPISIFPLPAGYLVLPVATGVEDVQASLLSGMRPVTWPQELIFYRDALDGHIERAATALANDNTLVGQYNHFVLRSSPESYRTLRAILENSKSELLPLLDVVAYALGYIERVPVVDRLDGELAAFVLMTQASHFIEAQEFTHAAKRLQEARQAAASSPIFAAQLLGELAELEHQSIGANPGLAQRYRQAIDTLAGTELALTRAELLLNLGICYQEMAGGQRGALMQAIHCYQDALQIFKPAEQAELFALAHNNLALAYLSMPMTEASDQLRMGIAVQSLREALKIYTQATHPEMWSSTQLNLANALQYLPSSHPEENLAEAVELYEEILSARSPEDNPLGYARLLANQGNALAHLGIHQHAVEKLKMAHTLFIANNEPDAAESVSAVLAEIGAARRNEP